jgi:hypothetical protein
MGETMSITNIWPRRRPVIDEQEPRPWKLPPDLEQQLVDAMDDFGDTQQPEPVRTAKDVADDITYYIAKLAEGEEWLAKGKAQLAELEAELTVKIGEEMAAHQAEYAAKLAELEKLKTITGDTHANADADPRHAGDAGPDHDAGRGAAMPEPAADQGEASGPAPALPVG